MSQFHNNVFYTKKKITRICLVLVFFETQKLACVLRNNCLLCVNITVAWLTKRNPLWGIFVPCWTFFLNCCVLFLCVLCGIRKRKLKTNQPSKPFICRTCGRSYAIGRHLKRHMTIECGLFPQLHLPLCPNLFRYRAYIKRNLLSVHQLDSNEATHLARSSKWSMTLVHSSLCAMKFRLAILSLHFLDALEFKSNLNY